MTVGFETLAEGRVLNILFPFDKRGTLEDGCESNGLLRTVRVTVVPGEALVLG